MAGLDVFMLVGLFIVIGIAIMLFRHLMTAAFIIAIIGVVGGVIGTLVLRFYEGMSRLKSLIGLGIGILVSGFALLVYYLVHGFLEGMTVLFG